MGPDYEGPRRGVYNLTVISVLKAGSGKPDAHALAK